MSRTIDVPDEIYERAAKMAAERQVALAEYISAALAHQMAAQDYMSRRAARSSDAAFQAALDQIPDVDPEEYDR